MRAPGKGFIHVGKTDDNQVMWIRIGPYQETPADSFVSIDVHSESGMVFDDVVNLAREVAKRCPAIDYGKEHSRIILPKTGEILSMKRAKQIGGNIYRTTGN